MRVVWLAALVLTSCGGDPGGNPIDGSVDAALPDASTRCDACCGNGVVEGTEACDDGDVNDFDGCSHDCRFESALVLQAIHEQPGGVGCDLNGDGTIENIFGASLNDAARALLSDYVSSTLLRGCVIGELWVLIGNDREMLAAP